LWRAAADLCFGDFMLGQFHHCKVSLPQGADDLIEADLQGPSLGRAGLRWAVLFHDHNGAPAVWSYSFGNLSYLQRQKKTCISLLFI